MRYQYEGKKIVIVISSTLKPALVLNVVGHLAVSLGANGDKELMGRMVLLDKSGVAHLGISRYPIIVTKVRPVRLKKLVEMAKKKAELLIVDYPKQMLTTKHDDDLSIEMTKSENTNMEYFGALLYGESDIVSDLTGNFALWE